MQMQKTIALFQAISDIKQQMTMHNLFVADPWRYITFFNAGKSRGGIINEYNFEVRQNVTNSYKDKSQIKLYLSQHLMDINLRRSERLAKSEEELWETAQELRAKGSLKDPSDEATIFDDIYVSDKTPVDFLTYRCMDKQAVLLHRDLLQLVYDTLIDAALAYPSKILQDLSAVEKEIEEVDQNVTDLSKHKGSIKWKGSYKQLAEMFVYLEAKGYIELEESGLLKARTEAIVRLFNLSDNQKAQDSKSINSFYNLFNTKANYNEVKAKPADAQTEAKYVKIFTPRYKPVFTNIKPLSEADPS